MAGAEFGDRCSAIDRHERFDSHLSGLNASLSASETPWERSWALSASWRLDHFALVLRDRRQDGGSHMR
jgi:hypothetical protein